MYDDAALAQNTELLRSFTAAVEALRGFVSAQTDLRTISLLDQRELLQQALQQDLIELTRLAAEERRVVASLLSEDGPPATAPKDASAGARERLASLRSNPELTRLRAKIQELETAVERRRADMSAVENGLSSHSLPAPRQSTPRAIDPRL